MKTREVLLAGEAELTNKLKEMKIKELDRHLEKILLNFGVDDFRSVISAVIKVLPELDSDDRYQAVQDIVIQKIPEVRRGEFCENALPPRVAIMIIVLITKQFEKIHRENR